jgi:hypothetical protein
MTHRAELRLMLNWLVGIVFLILLYCWVGPPEWLFKVWLLWVLARKLKVGQA